MPERRAPSLIEEAQSCWGKPSDCVAENSFVVCKGKRISFGDIVAKGDLSRAYTDDQLAALPIKARKDRKLVGVQTAAIDIPAKAMAARFMA